MPGFLYLLCEAGLELGKAHDLRAEDVREDDGDLQRSLLQISKQFSGTEKSQSDTAFHLRS